MGNVYSSVVVLFYLIYYHVQQIQCVYNNFIFIPIHAVKLAVLKAGYLETATVNGEISLHDNLYFVVKGETICFKNLKEMVFCVYS